MLQLEVKGLDAVVKKFETLSNESQAMVQVALNAWADATATDAINMAPTDETGLRKSIKPEYGNGSASVKVMAKYGAYMEFGTRKFAAQYISSLPNDWQTFANEFKGPMEGGGNFKEMVKSIMAWCGRKGIDEKAAYPIARKIMIQGVRPHPFLYPAVNKNLLILIKDIKDIFK